MKRQCDHGDRRNTLKPAISISVDTATTCLIRRRCSGDVLAVNQDRRRTVLASMDRAGRIIAVPLIPKRWQICVSQSALELSSGVCHVRTIGIEDEFYFGHVKSIPAFQRFQDRALTCAAASIARLRDFHKCSVHSLKRANPGLDVGNLFFGPALHVGAGRRGIES